MIGRPRAVKNRQEAPHKNLCTEDIVGISNRLEYKEIDKEACEWSARPMKSSFFRQDNRIGRIAWVDAP